MLDLPDERARRVLIKTILEKHNMTAGLSDYDIRCFCVFASFTRIGFYPLFY